MPQFDLATFPGQMFWILVIFGLQYFIIAKVIVPGFKTLFNKRQRHLDQQLQQTEELSTKAERLKLDYELKLLEMKKKNAEIIKTVIKKAELESELRLVQLENQFIAEVEKQEQDFKRFDKNIDIAINEVTLDLASDILGKMTQTKVNKKKLTNQ